MARTPTAPTSSPTDNPMDTGIGNGTESINPGAPEAFEARAQQAVADGIAASSLIVRIYNATNATPGTPGKFVGSVNYADFGEEIIASRFGAGAFVTHLSSTDNRARGVLKVHRMEIDAAAVPATLAASNPARPAAAAVPTLGGDFTQALLLQMMQQSQTNQLEAMKQQTAMMTALVQRPAADTSHMWQAAIAIVPQLFDFFAKRSGGGSTLGQVRELLDYIEDRRGDKPADESPLKWIMETIVPAFMQAMQKPAAATAQQPPRPALPAATPTPGAAHTAPPTTDQPKLSAPASAAAAPSEAQQSGQPEAGTGPEQPPEEMQPLIDFANAIAPVLKAAGVQEDPDTETYAEVVYDMAYAFGVAHLFDPDQPEGTLSSAIEAMHEDLSQVRDAVLIPIERHLRRFAMEERQAASDANDGQMRIGDQIDPARQKKLDSLAAARAAKAARKATQTTTTAPEGQKGQ